MATSLYVTLGVVQQVMHRMACETLETPATITYCLRILGSTPSTPGPRCHHMTHAEMKKRAIRVP